MAPQQRASILCPRCRMLVSVQTSRCLHCGMARPGAWWKNNALTRGLHNAVTLVRMLLAVNIGMYVLSLLLAPMSSDASFNPLTLLSPGTQSLLLLGATGTIPIDGLQRWWTLVSANYLHGGILHLAFNMMALRQLGPFVAEEYGVSRLISLYTLTGIIGFGVSYLAGIRFTIGASAAICGLIGATLYYGKSRGGAYGRTIYRQVGSWAIAIFVFGLVVPGINNWGHGGGMAAGVLLGFLLGYQEQRRESLLHTLLANACLVLTALILAWVIFSGMLYKFSG